MVCSNCHKNVEMRTEIVQEVQSSDKSVGAGKVICTWIICFPWGLYNLIKGVKPNEIKSTSKVVTICPECGFVTKTNV